MLPDVYFTYEECMVIKTSLTFMKLQASEILNNTEANDLTEDNKNTLRMIIEQAESIYDKLSQKEENNESK